MIAPLSSAASAGLLMAVPTIVGAFFWKKASAAGALSSMVIGSLLVLALQFSGYKPLGLWPGVWGLVVCVILYIVIGLLTEAPLKKAQDFIGYVEENMVKHKFL
jgi:SSS family solute:Na+ symporter